MEKKIKRILCTALKVKASRKLLKKKIVAYRPVIVDVSKSADINITGCLSVNNEWTSERKLKNKFIGSLHIGDNAKVEIGDFTCYAGSQLTVTENAVFKAEDAYMNYGSVIVCKNRIEIGKHCLIGERVKISDSNNHRINYDGYKVSAPIIIGEHVWICNDSTILCGVTIGDGAVVAAGSVVTKDVPAKCVVAGVPARVIRENIFWTE